MSLTESLTRGYGRSILTLKKQSPHIFFIAGVAGVITSTVLACRATMKVAPVLDEIKGDFENINSVREAAKAMQVASFDEIENNYKKDVIYIYTKSGIQIIKLYGPAIIVGTVSIAALTGSHVQLTRRNSALMAAYAILQQAFDEYRNRVREELGDEKELELHHAITTETIKGEKLKSADPNKWSPYAKFFDEYSKYWEKDAELNRMFVQCQQNYANNLLRTRGHIFLNEVYDMIGVERTKAGAVVGWVVGPDGDNFVDFGIYEAFSSRFVNGLERSIILDFNVDGVIYDKI